MINARSQERVSRSCHSLTAPAMKLAAPHMAGNIFQLEKLLLHSAVLHLKALMHPKAVHLSHFRRESRQATVQNQPWPLVLPRSVHKQMRGHPVWLRFCSQQ